jgi:hypothetical protein
MATSREQNTSVEARTQADKIIISTMIHDYRKRLRSYELIAGAFAVEEYSETASFSNRHWPDD